MKEVAQQDVSSNRKIGLDNQPNLLFVILLMGFAAITGRLFWLQILQGSFYQKLSDENRIRLVSRPPIRGRLLDLRGKVLADSRVTYSLSVQPRLVAKQKWPSLRDRLSNYLKISKKSLENNFPIKLENIDTFVDGASVSQIGSRNFKIWRIGIFNLFSL